MQSDGSYIPPPIPDHIWARAKPVSPEEQAEMEAVTAALAARRSESPSTDGELDTRSHFPEHPELDQAIDDNDADRVLEELAAGRRRFHPEATLNTAIKHAIERENLQMVRLLMDNGVPAELDNMELATKTGNIPLVVHLMEHFSWPIDRQSHHGMTLLTLAVEHPSLVQWLLSRGADVNQEDYLYHTPLDRAIESGPKTVVRMLMDAGADLSRGTPVAYSLVRLLQTGEGLELMEEFLDRGAPVDKLVGEESVDWPFEQSNALHFASRGAHRNLAAVKILLAHGADPSRNRRAHGADVPFSSVLDRAKNDPELWDILQYYKKKADGASKANL